MENEFLGTAWTEEDEQAFQDDWARRILTCVRWHCRRNRECLVTGRKDAGCPMLTILPSPEERARRKVEYARAYRIERLAELNGEIEPAAAEARRAAYAEQGARRRALAFKRVEAELAATSPKRRKR